MAIEVDASIRARPLEDVKREIVKRAGHRNPLEGIKPEDARAVADVLASTEGDEWAGVWSEFGRRYEAEADRLAKAGGDRDAVRERYLLAFN
jgi:hypothetical protein